MSENEVTETPVSAPDRVSAELKSAEEARLGDFGTGTMEQKFVELFRRADDLGQLTLAYQISMIEKAKDDPEQLEKVSQYNRIVLTFCANVQDFLSAMAQDPDEQGVSQTG